MKRDYTRQGRILRSWRKAWRYALIYGPVRACIKALGRTRLPLSGSWIWRRSGPRVGVIGCGQFAFSTLAYFVKGCCRIDKCYDLDRRAAESFARFWGVEAVAASAEDVLCDPTLRCIFIASNHASHADYAVAALAAGKDVYLEKPVAVEREQLRRLSQQREAASGRLFAGYNRPFSAAVQDLRAAVGSANGPLTISCFVSGHVIGAEHWYRLPSEGTRICGNVGHWLDLVVHMLGWRSLPDRWRISLMWSRDETRDDDLAISLTSEVGDLVSIVLTSRTEPFEGIRESINVQWGDWICSIDDFRRMTLWNGSAKRTRRYWPKDVGHKNAARQPFQKATRPWSEVEDSTLLMLMIADMVRHGTRDSVFSFAEQRALLRTSQ